jgi:ATP-dependent RNA helicase SUPV3L1/SUV3
MVALQTSEIKQIAGRAGRYRIAEQSANEGTESNDVQTEIPVEKAPTPEFDGVVDIDDNIPLEEVPLDKQSTKNTNHREAEPEKCPSAALQSKKPDAVNVSITSPTPSKSTGEGTVGYVTTLERIDFARVARAVGGEAEIIKTAGLFPPARIIERFAAYFPPGTPFSYILLRLNEISRLHPRFHICGLKDQLIIADIIQPVKGLTTGDRIIFCSAPAPTRDPEIRKLLRTLAECVGKQKRGGLLDIPEFNLELLDQDPLPDRVYLAKLESLHRGIVLYLWLSFHFSGVFTTRGMANYVKGLVEGRIEVTLSKISYSDKYREKLKKKREKAMIDDLKREIMAEKDVENEEWKEQETEDGDEVELNEERRAKTLVAVEVQEVKDVLGDTQSFREDDRDLKGDHNEYNTPELEMWEQFEPRGNGALRPSKFGPFDSIDEIQKMVIDITANTQALRDKTLDLETKMNLKSIDLSSGYAAEIIHSPA